MLVYGITLSQAMTKENSLPGGYYPVDAQNRAIVDDDAGFVAQCRQGDTEAFTQLVRRHQKKMLNIAFRMIGDYDEACDVVQESFLSAFRAIGKFRGEARFSTWLCGIVLNHSRSHIQQRGARTRHEGVSLDDPFRFENGNLYRRHFSEAETVVERIEKQELEAKIQESISSLDGEQREVLVLRDIQGFSYEEIGETLKLPQGTVRSRLFRARNTLKDNLLKLLGNRNDL
jgi:RNA polymerase sigma-70 factor, ECF subfamily